jgi:hypothetical protein
VKERLLQLAQRITEELVELAQVVQRAQEGWARTQQSSDDLYLDGVALNLHGFYAGLERLFELIATTIDGTLPQGANWHQMLLQQMAAEIPGVRPAVISEPGRENLDEYRGFRHIVRHVYTFRFDPARIQRLVEEAPAVLGRVRGELQAFADFLQQQAPMDPEGPSGKEEGIS